MTVATNHMQQIVAANKAIGHHFFDTDTLEFFGSRVSTSPIVTDGKMRYFLTSEQDPHGRAWNGERHWTLRAADADGRILTISEFGEYPNRDAAVTALLAMGHTIG